MNTAVTKYRDAIGTPDGLTEARPLRARTATVIAFATLILLGALATVFPEIIAVSVATTLAIGVIWWAITRLKKMGLETWQGLLLIPLSGYMLLNYGFENITIHVGSIPVIISYVLMYATFALAIFSSRRQIGVVLREPAMLCIFGLLALSMFHLVVNIPAYGLWAIRDCTMILDGLFLILGLLWARNANIRVLINWLMFITVINLLYSFTFPWSTALLAWSPKSGVFMAVPILGQYHTNDIYLLQGAVFCLGLGTYLITRHRWVLFLLLVFQLLGLMILQDRAGYVTMAVFIVVLTGLGELKKSGTLVGMLCSALVVLILATSVGGLELSGRIGPVNVDFLADHLRSITGEKVTSASSVDSRFDWADEAMAHFWSSPIVGVGFGQVLIDYIDDDTGATVRFPHNSNLSILARLGIIGFAVWLLFNFCLLKRFFFIYSNRKQVNRQVYELVLWIFCFYLSFMISALVEAPLEFPSSAVPFYFLMGLALGLIRWHAIPKDREFQLARSETSERTLTSNTSYR
jgi:hypothetical protein